MTSRLSNEEAAERVHAWLVESCAEYGIGPPANVATHFDIQRIAFYVRVYYGEPGEGMFLDWMFDESFFEHPLKTVFEDIAEQLALDARVPIAERL